MGLFSSIGKLAGSVFGGSSTLDLIGSALDGGLPILGGISANNSAKASASKQMAFQQYNSNTSYQRAVADLHAAGLNPMLAYSNGGASTPSGASYSPQDVATPAARVSNETASTNSTVNLQKAQIDNTNSSTALNAASVLKSHADASLASAQAAKIAADIPERDVKSQFWRALLPTASSAKDVATGTRSLDDVLKEHLPFSSPPVSDYLRHPFRATSPAELKLNRRLRNLGNDASQF